MKIPGWIDCLQKVKKFTHFLCIKIDNFPQSCPILILKKVFFSGKYQLKEYFIFKT